jgi:DNA-directed RNA polymerase specialized sigma24 family protein
MRPVNVRDERIARVARIAKGIAPIRFRDDVLGDAYLTVVEAEAEGIPTEEAERRVRAACRNTLRRRWRDENRISFDVPKGGPAIADHPELWEAIKALRPRQYRAVVLRFWGGLSYSEIASEMHCSEKAAQNMLSRALANVKNNFLAGGGFCRSDCVQKVKRNFLETTHTREDM